MKKINIDTMLITIGKNLHTIRNVRKETMQSVGIDIGITHPVISKIENGRYPGLQVNLLIKLCNHYDIALQHLFSLEMTNLFLLTHNNSDGNQRLIGQEISTGYELYIQQLLNENQYLKEQVQQLLDKFETIK